LFEISIPAMEAMYDSMTAAPGAVGARQAGAGFGGCMVAFVEAEATESFCRAVAASYAKATGIVPEISPVRPAPGAGALELPNE
jgi:galactokinase